VKIPINKGFERVILFQVGFLWFESGTFGKWENGLTAGFEDDKGPSSWDSQSSRGDLSPENLRLDFGWSRRKARATKIHDS